MNIAEVTAGLEEQFQILGKTEFRGETSLTVSVEQIAAVCQACKERFGFDFLLDITSIDPKRDRGQNQARGLKTLGWLVLALGFGLQIAAACLTGTPA